MKTSRYFFGILSLLLIMGCSEGGNQKAEKDHSKAASEDQEAVETVYKADVSNSQIHWKGTMLGVYSHKGNISLKKGKLTTKGDQITGGSFVVDMSTITPTDGNYSEEKPKEKLVGHLSSPDFFDVANHPTAKFVIKEYKGNQLTGDLTIRGNTHEETVSNVVFNPDSSMMKGELEFDRMKYDVAFKHPAQDMVISNDISLDILVKLK